MTISEMKNMLTAVFEALDSVEVKGFGNRAKLNDSMVVLQKIMQSEIVANVSPVQTQE